jgi:hypothetical protein
MRITLQKFFEKNYQTPFSTYSMLILEIKKTKNKIHETRIATQK